MLKKNLMLILTLSLPLAASAKNYPPAQWVQFADAGWDDTSPLTRSTDTAHLADPSAGKKAPKKAAKRHHKKKGKSLKLKMSQGTPLKIQYAF